MGAQCYFRKEGATKDGGITVKDYLEPPLLFSPGSGSRGRTAIASHSRTCNFNFMQGEPKEEKNIRRRVYDALNVMIAAGVLERELEGTYRSATTRLHFHNSPLASRKDQLQAEIIQQRNRIVRKKELLGKMHSKLQAVRRCLDRNRNAYSPPTNRLDFPLVALVQTGRRRVRVEAEEEQLALWHPCLAIYSETDLLEEAWL